MTIQSALYIKSWCEWITQTPPKWIIRTQVILQATGWLFSELCSNKINPLFVFPAKRNILMNKCKHERWIHGDTSVEPDSFSYSKNTQFLDWSPKKKKKVFIRICLSLLFLKFHADKRRLFFEPGMRQDGEIAIRPRNRKNKLDLKKHTSCLQKPPYL